MMRAACFWALVAAAAAATNHQSIAEPPVARPASQAADYSLRPLYHSPVGDLPGYAGDPNGMLYRADHELFHFFWQCSPDELMAKGASWCHSVSRNFVEWENKPIAIGASSFSGAATLMDDAHLTPVMTFACFGDDRKDWTAATAGGICQARPADMKDRHLTNWSLSDHDTDGLGLKHTDPGTGWRGPDGVWRLIVGNQMTSNVTNGSNIGAFRTWESPDFGRKSNFTLSSSDPFHHFTWQRCITHPTLCGGSGWEPRDPEFFELPDSGGLFLIKGSQKMCTGVGRDYVALGTVDADTQRFKPLYPGKRDIGSDLYDGGEFWASQTVLDTRRNRRILMAWVPESDCPQNQWPLKCNSTLSRGWNGVHSLPRTVELDVFPEEDGLPSKEIKTPPLPELNLLRVHPKPPPQDLKASAAAAAAAAAAGGTTSAAARGFTLNPGDVHELPEKGSSAEVRVVFELPHNLSDTANWDVGVQLLWSEDGSELTRFGLRPAHNLTGTDLVDIYKGDLQTISALANAAACEAACKAADGCLAWTFTPSERGSDSSCRLKEHLPQHSMTHEACWTPFAGYSSVSGILPRKPLLLQSQNGSSGGNNRTRFLQAYLDRSKSWLDTPENFNPGDGLPSTSYGHHSYGMTVRLRPEETTVELIVYADLSIVEGFAANGRAAITARVYPTTKHLANRIGLYAVAHEDNVGVRVKSVQAWKMKGAKAAEGSQMEAPAV